MRKSLMFFMLQIVFWGVIAYSAGLVFYKVGRTFNTFTTKVFAGEEKK